MVKSVGVFLPIELRIVAKDVFLVERKAPPGVQVLGQTGTDRDAIVKRYRARKFFLKLRDGIGKGVAQPGDHLKQRKIRVAELSAQQVAVALQIGRASCRERVLI